jgi:hypothetical protein
MKQISQVTTVWKSVDGTTKHLQESDKEFQQNHRSNKIVHVSPVAVTKSFFMLLQVRTQLVVVWIPVFFTVDTLNA